MSISLFSYLNVKPDLFDTAGDKKYLTQSPAEQQKRGGQNYNRPLNCVKYGLNVKQKYGQLNWLGNKNKQGEWAVAYYIINFPNKQKSKNIQNLAFLSSFFQTLTKKQPLSQDKDQPYKDQEDRKNLGNLVGKGVYCYRTYNMAVNNSVKITIQNTEYKIILQCRVNPYFLRIPNVAGLYVVKGSQNIRPYAIILEQKKTVNPYQNPVLTNQSFIYQKKRKNKIKLRALNNMEISMRGHVRRNKQGKQQVVHSINFEKVINAAKPGYTNAQIPLVLQEIYKQNKEVVTHICNQIINNPITEQEKWADQYITKKMEQQERKSVNKDIKKNSNSVILCLKQKLSKQGTKVTLQQNSSIKSVLSLQALTTGLLMDRVKITEQLTTQSFKFDIELILRNQNFRQQFENWYLQRICQQLKLNRDQITIHVISEGVNCIKVQWSTQNISSLKNANKIKEKLTLHPYFQQFFLSPQDFDPKGNRQFENQCNYTVTRGGLPYYQPILATRYGLKVRGRYENDNWLQMDSNPQQWAIAFHGVRSPNSICNNGKKVLDSIISGIEEGNMLRVGQNQVHKDDDAINKPNQKVGTGVYCSPHIKQCLFCYTQALKVTQSKFEKEEKVIHQDYHLVFQCRVNPKKLKIPKNRNQYWVLNQPQDIRPYGIILVTDKNAAKIPYPTDQFQQVFRYQKYQKQFEHFISQDYRIKFYGGLKEQDFESLEQFHFKNRAESLYQKGKECDSKRWKECDNKRWEESYYQKREEANSKRHRKSDFRL